MENLGKIPRIHKRALEPEQEFQQRLTKRSSLLSNSALPRDDYISIYKNKTILYIGDNTMRVLYRDIVKLLVYNRLLEYTEASCANGNFKPIVGESLVKANDSVQCTEYENIRIFNMENYNITIIFIYVSTIFDKKPSEQLKYITDKRLEKKIDLVFMSSYITDFNSTKLASVSSTIDEYIYKYISELNFTLKCIRNVCQSERNPTQMLYWITPHPNKTDVFFANENQFREKLLNEIDSICVELGYHIYDRFDLWMRRKDFVNNQTGYLTLHGIREMNDTLARNVANHWKLPFTSSIPVPSSLFSSK